MFSVFTLRNSNNKDLSSKYFFLTSTKSVHCIKIRLTVIIENYMQHKQGALPSSTERSASNKNAQYVVHLELCLLSLSDRLITVCLKALVKSHEACWIL